MTRERNKPLILEDERLLLVAGVGFEPLIPLSGIMSQLRNWLRE
jgi:hypothetical protein